jgi:hypothetical protein
MATSSPSGEQRMPQAGGSNVPTAKAPDASASLGQEDAAIARLPENATEPQASRRATQGEADAPEPSDRLPTAGSHARPHLTNPDSTPGTGLITPAGGHDDVDSASG